MKVIAKLNNLRIAPRKTRLVAELINGMDVKDAIRQLDVHIKRGALPIKKLLDSAIANGENNFGIDKDNMYVYSAIVESGIMLKRWIPKAHGRATPIRKRNSNIIITLEERVEGKGRKTKEQLEKEKQSRIEAKNKLEKEAVEKQDKEEKEVKAEKIEAKSKEAKAESKTAGKNGWAKKIFNRKTGM